MAMDATKLISQLVQPANQAKMEPSASQTRTSEEFKVRNTNSQNFEDIGAMPQKTEALKLGQLTMKQGIKRIDIESFMAQTSL